MTIKEVSKELNIQVRTVREWIRTGKLNAVKKGRIWDISESDIRTNEVIERVNAGRKYSSRFKGVEAVGMLAGGQNTPESTYREEC